MADGMEFDVSELERLAVNLGKVPAAALVAARGVVSKGAVNIKNDTRKNISDDPSWKHMAQAVNYSMSGNAFVSAAVIGYDDVGQGELAGIYEFGSARRAPHPTLYPAAAREVPGFEKAIAEVAGKATEATL